jgi:hypothetical protein
MNGQSVKKHSKEAHEAPMNNRSSKEPIRYDYKKMYMDLLVKHNGMVTEHNQLVDKTHGLMSFIILQCGVLHAAITGQPDGDPLEPISKIIVDEGNTDLVFMLNGLITFVNKIKETGDVKLAQAEWEKYIAQ